MSEPSTPKRRINPFKNWISLSGMVIAAGSFFAFLLLFAIDLFAHQGSLYMGILAYVVAPGFLILGLVTTAVGVWQHFRHAKQETEPGKTPSFSIDITRPRDRKILIGFLCSAAIFLMLTAFGSYETYEFTDSVVFCGEVCHTPMKPEYVAYQHSPHAKVRCTECHVGPGAENYLKAKLNGVHQLVATMTDSFERPIPTPVKNISPAEDTCQHCHWPNRNVGNIERTYEHFLMDEENTPFAVRMILNVGGGDPDFGPAEGIHWHMNLNNKVEYIATDEQRQNIPWVRLTDVEGKVTVFQSEELEGDPSDYEIRTMDCLDCHNRPAHQFYTPNDAVDTALSIGHISPEIPWIKSNLVATLIADYETEDQALSEIDSRLRELYPDQEEIDSVIAEAQKIFSRNIFPEMNADWRAYPDNSGHKNWQGCFRCHDGLHFTEDFDQVLSASDCNSCHTILAQGSGEELFDLSVEGHDFFHVDAPYTDFACAECHNGAIMEEE